MKVIDLTRELPANPSSWEAVNHEVDWTRIESPGSLVKNGKLLYDYELPGFISKAVLLDLTHKNSGDQIDDEDFEAAEEEAGLAIREGEIAILQTGWDSRAARADYFAGFPALSDNAAEYLEFKRVAGVGVDTPSVDRLGREDLRAHTILFSAGMFVIENLCGLEMIDESRFRLIALPLKMKSSVSPVRAVAVFDDGID